MSNYAHLFKKKPMQGGEYSREFRDKVIDFIKNNPLTDYKQVAKKFSISIPTVYNWCWKAGIATPVKNV